MKNSVWTISLLCCGVLVGQLRAADLEKGFAQPPDSAKPHVWWHWMNGNVTKDGITADLEAMKRAGIGGAQIFNVGSGIPAGPVAFFTPEWRGMMKHAAKEADRLGLKLGLHNCAGWSSSGGPWNTPENAMRQLTLSETGVKGPSHFSAALPQPPAQRDFYQDIAVFAFSTPTGEDVTMQSLSPIVTASAKELKGETLFDGKIDTIASLPLPAPGKDSFLQFEFPQPLAARSVQIVLTPAGRRAKGVIQASDDGQKFNDVQEFAFPDSRTNDTMTVALGNDPVPVRFYRVKFTGGGVSAPRIDVAEVSFSPALHASDVPAKSGMNSGFLAPSSRVDAGVPDGFAVKRERMIDLTGQMGTDGRLDWEVPEGAWTILRIGCTLTGRENVTPPQGGSGLECDKLSSRALDAHWAGFVQNVLDDLGPLAGKDRAFSNVLIDSYEVGGQNWTPKFREEFRRLRGYDPLPWLVTLSGRVVDDPVVTERFLWDMRRTVADLFAEKYYGHFKELCNRRGLTASLETYGGPFEALQSGGAADIPMGEFWVEKLALETLKLASSIGHIYGRPVIGAESFTAGLNKNCGRWQNDPYSLKALGDLVFCAGINRYIFHSYAMQPWLDRWPGMTMGPWGTPFGRTCTWWEQGGAWMKYIARCQFMLQQGLFVADIAAFCGENAPATMPAIDPKLPPGYDYDGINADVLLNRAAVKDGLLMLDGGMSYRVLLLPQSDRAMTPKLLRKLRDFAAAGLTVVGPPPVGSPSLEGYPQCDGEVKTLVAEIWGDCDGKTITEHRLGKGKVVWGQTMVQVFASSGTKPDFEYPAGSRLAYIHRLAGDADIYFVSNQRDRFDSVDCSFRVSGKVPELWHPDTGRIGRAPVWREEGGRTIVPLTFDPAGSVFVVFRNKEVGDHVVSAKFSTAASPAAPGPELTIQEARYESVTGTQGRDVTALLARKVRDGALKIEVLNTELGGDSAPMSEKQLRVKYASNGQVAEKIAAENTTLEIGPVSVSDGRPPLELISGTDGQVKLAASSPGSVELKTSSGGTLKAEVAGVPEPVEVAGPWELNFPANWGAPARVTLPQLISWTEHADSGVKYFSGTAIYVKEVDIPEAMFGGGNSLWLNLGIVKNLAEVSVNGKPLGVLWKPPFRADITGAAKPGKNRLEIKIINLWPNRLIGDEQLPPDCEWLPNGALKQWPQWLLEGKPSPTGRLTFTTWHHWKKDDKPLPSGLLGPVTVSTEVKILAK